MSKATPAHGNLTNEKPIDSEVLRTSSLAMTAEAEAETARLVSRSDNVSSRNLSVPAFDIGADLGPSVNSTSEEGTKPRPQELPTTLSDEDIDVVLDNAALLSLYYDSLTSQFKHEMKYKLEKDRDSDTIRLLLNCPGVIQTGGPLSPRLDVFFIDGSLEGDYSIKWDVPDPPIPDGWDWATVDTVKIQSRYRASAILHKALNFELPPTHFIDNLRAEKIYPRYSKHVLQGSTRCHYFIGSSWAEAAWSYDEMTCQTLGIMMYRKNPRSVAILANLITILTENRELAACPMLLGLAAQEACTMELEEVLNLYRNDVIRIEHQTGYNDFLKADQHDQSTDKLDTGAETAVASGVAGQLALLQINWRGLQALAELAIQEIQNAIHHFQGRAHSYANRIYFS